MLSYKADIPVDKVKTLFYNEGGIPDPQTGYPCSNIQKGVERVIAIQDQNRHNGPVLYGMADMQIVCI